MANKRKLEYPDWFLSELSDSIEKENLSDGERENPRGLVSNESPWDESELT